MVKITGWIELFCFIAIVILAIYGSVQLYNRTDRLERIELIKVQEKKITQLESKNYWLKEVDKKCLEIVSVMEEILNPLQGGETSAQATKGKKKING